jgi:hypothetical protein
VIIHDGELRFFQDPVSAQRKIDSKFEKHAADPRFIGCPAMPLKSIDRYNARVNRSRAAFVRSALHDVHLPRAFATMGLYAF